jgi:hypothetical protein
MNQRTTNTAVQLVDHGSATATPSAKQSAHLARF